MKKVTLSKMNVAGNSSLQSLIEANELHSVFGGSSDTCTDEGTAAYEAAKQDHAYYRAIIPPVKR